VYSNLRCALLFDPIRRWEVFHGQNSDSGSVWEANSKNLRPEGSHSLENIRFVLDEGSVKSLGAAINFQAKEELEVLKALACFVSPDRSGIADEILALMKMDIIEIDERGACVLAEEWWANADLLLLEDMNLNWGRSVDPRRKHGVSEKIQKILREKWRRTESGWVANEEPNSLVFDFEEFDDWREAFERKQQSLLDDSEGIGWFF